MAKGATIGLAVAGAAEDYSGEQSQENALTVEGKQSMIEYQQKSLANYDMIENVIDAQTAAATTRGYTLSSPSFDATQIGTYNKGAQASQNIQTEEDISQDNIATEKQNVRDQFVGKLLGLASSTAGDLYSYGRSTPSTTTQNPFTNSTPQRKNNFPGGGLPNGIPQRLPGT